MGNNLTHDRVDTELLCTQHCIKLHNKSPLFSHANPLQHTILTEDVPSWQDSDKDKGELTWTTWKRSSSSVQLLIHPLNFHPLLLTIIALSSFSHCGDLLEENSGEENLLLSLLTPLLYFLQPLLIVACLEKPNHPFVKSTPISSFLTEVFRLFLLFSVLRI